MQVKYQPPWFKALVWSEVLLQLPFFFVGTYGFALGREWIKTPSLVYGLCVATTMLPILGEIILTANREFNKYIICGFYLPYLLIPLAIAVRALAKPRLFQPPMKDSYKWL